MNKSFPVVWTILGLSFSWAILGCGSSETPLAPVTGVVTYQGEPLPRGTIVFTPDTSRGTRGPIALGKIEADGKYTLYTKNDPGAVSGWHVITIVAVEEPMNASLNNAARPRMLLPQKYQSPSSSGLVREVKTNEPNIIDFELD